ncbi:hypothetical protein SEA_MORGANA_140 [Gordonia phage Morgana]|uniref:Uncharacterized protein n=1 Tax=Gordonia phage Morgana TaxID=3137292 RepID=A0AAX4RBN0_9CAUD
MARAVMGARETQPNRRVSLFVPALRQALDPVQLFGLLTCALASREQRRHQSAYQQRCYDDAVAACCHSHPRTPRPAIGRKD